MDAIVTARIPVEKKSRGNAVLGEIGSSPTKLINAAYDYVIREGRLPGEIPSAKSPGPAIRKLSSEQTADIESFLSRTRITTSDPFAEQADYKSIIAKGKLRDYEELL